jgi:Kdo2-lipid IVA lauroyltransferase/acyltransferase
MNALVYYLSLPFLYAVSLLPFRGLYLLSDVIFFILYTVFGYRKKVVLENLRNSFPEKTDKEIRMICSKFYRYFCDLTLETIKTLTITPASVKKHVLFEEEDLAVFQRLHEEGRSIVIVMGHVGNWELCGARFSIEPVHQLYVVYHPLRNPYFDKLLYHMRTRSGTRLYSMKETFRGMISNKDQLTATALIADQTPSSPQNSYWTTFLHQDTPVFLGPGKVARMFEYPVVYISVKRLRRGLYRIASELLIDQPGRLKEEEILEIFTRRLEKDIIEQPEIWLWTHRRWKHRREF